MASSTPIKSSACSLVRSFDSQGGLDIDGLSCADMSLSKDTTDSFKERMAQNHGDVDEFGASGSVAPEGGAEGPDIAHEGGEQTVSVGEGYLPAPTSASGPALPHVDGAVVDEDGFVQVWEGQY